MAKVCAVMKSQPLSSDPAVSSLPTSQNSNPADVQRRNDDSKFDVFSKMKKKSHKFGVASDLNNINAFIQYLIYSKYQNATDFKTNE